MAVYSDQHDRQHTQQTDTGQPATSNPSSSSSPNSGLGADQKLSLGLLDDTTGHLATDSKDVAILRRLKLAILEGQHPYFKANVDLSNLQDAVLTAFASRPTNPGTHQSDLPTNTPLAGQTYNLPQDDNHTSPSDAQRSPIAMTVNGQSKYGKSEANSSLDQRLYDVEMKNAEPSETRITSKDFGTETPKGSAIEMKIDSNNTQPGTTYTLGRHTLLSPVESEPANRFGRKRSASDASTVIETNLQHPESTISIKRESPPYQLSGSQTISTEPTSSSLSSLTSATTTSTALTSENGANDTDASGKHDEGDADLSGYNPKYGNKADYLRHQKVRVKMIESIEEKRRLAHHSEERSQHKSPPHQTEGPSRRGTGPRDSPVREPEYVSRTHTIPPPLRAPSLHTRGTSPSSLRRAPSMDTVKDRLPPYPTRHQSPRGSRATSFSRPSSPPPGRYLSPQRPRDYSPPRDVRPQYLPYDEPRSVPARPRPVVSSPPRGSPPREPSAPRASDRQSMDGYSSTFPRNEARSFDLRPPPPSPAFPDHARDSGSFSIDRDDSWGLSARGLPRAPPSSRTTPPGRDASRERASFGSSGLPPNPTAGYRPQAVSDLPSTARYAAYDTPVRHSDPAWPPRDWDPSRPPEAKPKLQDRFTMEPVWSRESRDEYGPRSTVRDSDRGRDDFGPGPRERDGFRREPSPGYTDGLRSGFRRPSDIEGGIRPMKRSRPDDEYVPRGGPGQERGRYGLDGRPPSSDYYPREPVRRADDEYIPRTRPPYNSWNGPPP